MMKNETKTKKEYNRERLSYFRKAIKALASYGDLTWQKGTMIIDNAPFRRVSANGEYVNLHFDSFRGSYIVTVSPRIWSALNPNVGSPVELVYTPSAVAEAELGAYYETPGYKGD